MQDAKHTQGPWKLKRSGSVTDQDGDLIATCGYRVRVGSDEDDANAKLIAAAPELLAAALRLAHVPCERHGNIHCTMLPPDTNLNLCPPCQIRAAIAKATTE